VTTDVTVELYEWCETEGVAVEWVHLDGISGHYDDESRTITLDLCLTSWQERSNLAHEVSHAVWRDRPSADRRLAEWAEARADAEAARHLITPEAYAAAEREVGPDPRALAVELHVCQWVVEAWQKAASAGRSWTRISTGRTGRTGRRGREAA
jgi:hypothetical protein